MAEYADREHYIPLRRTDLVDLLARHGALPAEERPRFENLCRLVTAIYHFEYHQKLEELKNEYAPFDPDRVECPLRELSPEERQAERQKLFDDNEREMIRLVFAIAEKIRFEA